MCFTPAVSLTTALIEWALAIVLLTFYRRSTLRVFGAVLLFLLGAYQFSEFMLCTTNNAELWGTAAFLSYAFLPAVGLHAIAAYLRRRINPALLYGLPTVFAFVAVAQEPFIRHAACETLFVTIRTYFSAGIPWLAFAAYYFGYILTAFLMLRHALRSERGSRKVACRWLLAAIFLMFIPTLVLMLIFPALRVRFPSILCHFALLTAAAFFIAVHKDGKRKT